MSHGEAGVVNRSPSHSMTSAEGVRSVEFPTVSLLLQLSMVFMANIPGFGLIIYLPFTMWYFKGFSGTCWLTLYNKCCTIHKIMICQVFHYKNYFNQNMKLSEHKKKKNNEHTGCSSTTGHPPPPHLCSVFWGKNVKAKCA